MARMTKIVAALALMAFIVAVVNVPTAWGSACHDLDYHSCSMPCDCDQVKCNPGACAFASPPFLSFSSALRTDLRALVFSSPRC